jgi:hypothetical protein
LIGIEEFHAIIDYRSHEWIEHCSRQAELIYSHYAFISHYFQLSYTPSQDFLYFFGRQLSSLWLSPSRATADKSADFRLAYFRLPSAFISFSFTLSFSPEHYHRRHTLSPHAPLMPRFAARAMFRALFASRYFALCAFRRRAECSIFARVALTLMFFFFLDISGLSPPPCRWLFTPRSFAAPRHAAILRQVFAFSPFSVFFRRSAMPPLRFDARLLFA